MVTVVWKGHLATVPPSLHLLSYRPDTVGVGLCPPGTDPQPNPYTSLHCKMSLKLQSMEKGMQRTGNFIHRGDDSEEDLNEFAWEAHGVWDVA